MSERYREMARACVDKWYPLNGGKAMLRKELADGLCAEFTQALRTAAEEARAEERTHSDRLARLLNSVHRYYAKKSKDRHANESWALHRRCNQLLEKHEAIRAKDANA